MANRGWEQKARDDIEHHEEKEKTMKEMLKRMFVLCVIGLFTVGFIGCEKEGPAEKAGKEIDKAFDSAKKKVEEAGH
jgi:hypothetical protein